MSFHFSLFCPLKSLANSFPLEYLRELFTFLFRAKFSLIEYCLIQIGHQEPLGCRDFHYGGICYMGLHPSLKFSIGFKLNSFSPTFQKVRYNCPKTSSQFFNNMNNLPPPPREITSLRVPGKFSRQKCTWYSYQEKLLTAGCTRASQKWPTQCLRLISN